MLNSVFLPLVNFLLISIGGRFLGRLGVMYLTVYLFLALLFYNSGLLYSLLLFNTTYYINLGVWFNVAHFVVYWEFIFDTLAASMLMMVSLISFIVHLYSFSYMKTDPHFNRFVSFLSFFTFFMFILVTANNFLQLFLGWEGVGLCSYLLINFWFTRLQANKAAIKALLMNRIGDIGFLLGVALVFNICYTVDFLTLTVLLPLYTEYRFVTLFQLSYIDLISFCFFIGVVGKSAQLGLHTWLPAAMEGPTPVSALIHAATMVTAGIFLLIRCSFLFECSVVVRNMIIVLGVLTAFFSALTALFLYDIKKIIAYSTCSQLGYMAVACGLSQYYSGFFHILNHAFFKALLFIAAGAIIHTCNNEQDIRRISLLFPKMPFLWIVFLVGNVAIMGLPFLAGFYSKDLIIEFVYFYPHITLAEQNLVFVFILLATACTGLYSLRLTYYLFFKENVLKHSTMTSAQPFFIQLALFLLLIGSCSVGYFLCEIFSPFFNALQLSVVNTVWLQGIEGEWLPWYIKIAPLLINFSSVGIYCFFIVFLSRYFYLEFMVGLFFYYLKLFKHIVQNNFYFNELYNYGAAVQFYFYYRYFFLIIDKGVLEFIGPSSLFSLYRQIVFIISWFYYQNLFLQILFLYHSLLAYFFYWFFFNRKL